MRIWQLLERTIDNMQVLRDCVETLIQNLPYQFNQDAMFDLHGSNMAGYNRLLQQYRNTPYKEFIKTLGGIGFYFKNLQKEIGKTTLGSYVGRPHNLVIFNISGFTGSAGPITTEQILATQRNDLPIKTFRAIMLHELRHVLQSTTYEPYYYGKGNDQVETNYKTAPVEIDAAWTHHLQDFNPSQFPTGNAYADAVMNSFTNYKTLNPTLQNHYRRKTIRYWSETHRPTQTDTLAQPAPQRMVAVRAQTKQWLVQAISQISNSSYDLRQLPGYNPESRMFLLPSNAMKATAQMIGNDKQISPESAPIAFLVASLVIRREQVPEVLRLLRGVQKITPQQAITFADHAFGNGWDSETMKRQIQSVFG